MRTALIVAAAGAAAATSQSLAQWTFTDETNTRLVLSIVTVNDDQEKDIAIGDLNQDGWMDVVVGRKREFSNPGPRNAVLLMNENGVLTDRTTTLAPDWANEPSDTRDVIIADFDGDGWLDVVFANTFHDQPNYFRNLGEDGGGNWLGLVDESLARFPHVEPPGQSPGPGPLFCASWAADLDNDDDLDIYFSNYNPGFGTTQDVLFMNDGSGNFTNETASRLGNFANVAFGSSVEMHDVNNDGWCDIVKTSTLFDANPFNPFGQFILFNDGTGVFNNLPFQRLDAAGGDPYMHTVLDLNNDGLLDMFHVRDGNDRVGRAISVNGDGTVNYESVSVNTSRLGGFGGNVKGGDLDGDGDLDVGVSSVDVDIANCDGFSAEEFTIVQNDGAGNLTDPFSSGNDQNYHLEGVHDFAFIDVDNDGDLDLLIGTCDNYVLLMQDGPPKPDADLNGDGVVDGTDLAIMLGSWGPGGGAADLNGDMMVNGADLAILLGQWGT